MTAVPLKRQFNISHFEGYYKVSFTAMASPCEFLVACEDELFACALAEKGLYEVRRIEAKFSRYLPDNICHQMNNANGAITPIDDECYRLLCFAQTCYDSSDGMFDLSSGVLRRAWKFDCSDNIPSQKQIDEILPLVGWQKITFDQQSIQMKAGMEIDFGGIGKEYAVSRVVDLFKNVAPDLSVLVNLGGDIQITTARASREPWVVGIESNVHGRGGSKVLSMVEGALATSGDSKRYLLKNKQRYSHILNPKTGWPIRNAPASVTVVAPLCIQSGCLATIALLNGKKAEAFLKEQDVQYWCDRQ